MDSKTYKRALLRNLNETGAAILESRALVGLEKAESYHNWDFFRVAYNALFNDMIAHSIKVLEKNKRSTTFWSLYEARKGAVDTFAKTKSHDLDFLNTLSGKDKLKHIRDKAHFHIDEKGVLDPKQVWKDAGIKREELSRALDIVWDILQHLYIAEFNKEFPLPDYDGSDATEIIKLWQNEESKKHQGQSIVSYLFDKE